MGYIKLFRSIREWGWYDDPHTLAVWVHLLVSANWKDGTEWHGETIPRGSLITSLSKLAAETGLSEKQVRSCIERLCRTGEIEKVGSNKWTKITICNYDTYQGLDDEEGQAEGEPVPAEPAPPAVPKKDEPKALAESKEKTKRFVKPTVEQVRAYCQENHYDIDPETFVSFYESKGWVVGKSPMKNWQAAVRQWVSRDRQKQGGGGLFPAEVKHQESLSLEERIKKDLEEQRRQNERSRAARNTDEQ